ncbi:MAG: UDP-N-acetylmuramate--L-alanine ligase [Candidatus Eremiobacteraeota bacterium]|nr:UDP-N-acetylmuramate--L-alanine ligase [Candidatus Eremiobacteraeota bacterium]
MSQTRGNLHFVGIGGIGMSAIARILLARGQSVSGSDLRETPLTLKMREAGATISIGHAAENIRGASALVVSSAIDQANPEYRAAKASGIPIWKRGEMLATLMRDRRGIAICGTHGKTTTTAMLATVLDDGGIDASLVLGGIAKNTGTNAHDGNSPWFLTEADESDGSFALLDPKIAVVTNLENDHIASDDELPRLVSAFDEFLNKLPEDGLAVIGSDNPRSASLARSTRRAQTQTFGLDGSADIHAANIVFAELGSSFDVIVADSCLGRVGLQVPGLINICNSLAAVAVGRELEIPFVQIARGLAAFAGVGRRFDILARTPRLIVVDDYAHHPTAVRATIAAARRYHSGPIVVAFQPHRYTRTAYLANEFASALQDADMVFLAPVYAAAEAPIPGISERSIGEPLRRLGAQVEYLHSLEALPETILDRAPRGSLALILGAGNITTMAGRLARAVDAIEVGA